MRKARSTLSLLLVGLALASCSSGSSPHNHNPAIAGLPVPAGSRIVFSGESDVGQAIWGAGYRATSYAARDGLTLDDVHEYYGRKLPLGQDFNSWTWCGDTTAPAGGLQTYLWERGAFILSLRYGVMEDPNDPLVPLGRVVVNLVRYPKKTGVEEFPNCA